MHKLIAIVVQHMTTEPMFKLIPSFNFWAIKPSGSWSYCEFVIYPYNVKDVIEYMEYQIFELRKNIWIYNCHRSYTHNLSSCEMINHKFVSFSAVQIYDLPYIHWHPSHSTGILRTHKVPSSQWLDRSVGRALRRYRRGHGFESRSGLISQLCNCDDQS